MVCAGIGDSVVPFYTLFPIFFFDRVDGYAVIIKRKQLMRFNLLKNQYDVRSDTVANFDLEQSGVSIDVDTDDEVMSSDEQEDNPKASLMKGGVCTVLGLVIVLLDVSFDIEMDPDLRSMLGLISFVVGICGCGWTLYGIRLCCFDEEAGYRLPCLASG